MRLKHIWSRVHPQYWRTRLRQYKVYKHKRGRGILRICRWYQQYLPGCRPEHCWRLRSVEPPRAASQWVRLWKRHLPVLAVPQLDRLCRDDRGGGHAGHLQVHRQLYREGQREIIFRPDPYICGNKRREKMKKISPGQGRTSVESGSLVVCPPGFFTSTPCSSEGRS